MKILLFTHKGCMNCKTAKKLLQKIISESKASFNSHILELDIENPEALAELLMLNTQHVPTILIGDTLLTGEDAISESKLRAVLSSKLKD